MEVAKNIVLAGIKTVSILDPRKAELRDLGSQFFLTEEDVGKPIGEVCVPKLGMFDVSLW